MRPRYSKNNSLVATVMQRYRASVLLGIAAFLLSAHVAHAQDTLADGEYTAQFKGSIHFTDREPSGQKVAEQATIRVSSSGGKLTIDVGQIGSTMSATRFTGNSGSSNFVAIHSVPGRENQAKVIWGQINNGVMRGTLLYPRVADGLVPGYTELKFEARSGSGNASNRSSTNSRPALNSRPSAAPALPTGSTSQGKKKKELKPRQPAPGSSAIYGTISGDTSVVINVQLVDENENTLKTTTLDQNGRYRFDDLGAALYWIYVNDGRAEAYITTTTGDRSVNADGSTDYRVDFHVRD